jgi:hypothetical protein
VQVSYDEGVAIHIGSESRAVAREGFGEALTGGRIGQPLSRERFLFWVPTPCIWRKATHPGASSRARAKRANGELIWFQPTSHCPANKLDSSLCSHRPISL